MGSEMCIRDRCLGAFAHADEHGAVADGHHIAALQRSLAEVLGVCLLYTSDAADERSSVDLGGRRIIKKQK